MRGVAGEYPLDPPTTFALGYALGGWVSRHHTDPEVVIGMDTRESGPWIAEHVAGGLARGGARARFAGLISTPGLAHVTRTGPFAAGVMISASHNPYQDNGIKIIDHSGFKLPDEQEQALEQGMFAFVETRGATEPRTLAVDEGLDREYIDHLAATLPHGLPPRKIVVDTANGAATHLAPALFRRLGQTRRLHRRRARWTQYQSQLRFAASRIICARAFSKPAPIWGSRLTATRIGRCLSRTPERWWMATRSCCCARVRSMPRAV